jgi:hypothetical protein
MFNIGLDVKNFEVVFKPNYLLQLKTNYIFVKLAKHTTILVENLTTLSRVVCQLEGRRSFCYIYAPDYMWRLLKLRYQLNTILLE